MKVFPVGVGGASDGHSAFDAFHSEAVEEKEDDESHLHPENPGRREVVYFGGNESEAADYGKAERPDHEVVSLRELSEVTSAVAGRAFREAQGEPVEPDRDSSADDNRREVQKNHDGLRELRVLDEVAPGSREVDECLRNFYLHWGVSE